MVQAKFTLQESAPATGVYDPMTMNLAGHLVDFEFNTVAAPFADVDIFDLCFVKEDDPARAAKIAKIVLKTPAIQLIAWAGTITLSTKLQPLLDARVVSVGKEES